MYGVISIVSGITAVIVGALMGMKLRVRYPPAGLSFFSNFIDVDVLANSSDGLFLDALICGFGMLLSAPFFYGFLVAGTGPLYWIYILSFIALWFINLNWALVGDILLVMMNNDDRFSIKFKIQKSFISILVRGCSYKTGDSGNVSNHVSSRFR